MGDKFSFKNIFGSISRLMAEDAADSHKPRGKSPGQKLHEDEIQNAILVLAAAVVRCDKNYTTGTEKFIRDFLARQFGTTGLTVRMRAVPSHIDIGTEPFTRISCKELKMLTTHDSRISIVHFLFGVAAADDFANAKEIRAIHRIAGYLGVSDKDFKEIKEHFIQENNPYKLLEIELDATSEQVRVAYRKMVLKYHPDKRAANVSEEEASMKFLAIKRAYELIKNAKQ